MIANSLNTMTLVPNSLNNMALVPNSLNYNSYSVSSSTTPPLYFCVVVS